MKNSHMKKGVLIVKNITREGPGLLATILEEQNIPSTLVDLDHREEIPPPEKYQALVVLGGPDSANDATEKIQHALRVTKVALEQHIPTLGICLGLQLLVKAAGGKVVPNPTKEVGLRDPDQTPFQVTLTAAGREDPLLAGLPDTFPVFHLHGETVTLTDQMTCLATGKYCAQQIVRVTPCAYGLQGHLELTKEMFTTWLREDPDLQTLPQQARQTDFNTLSTSYTQTGRRLFHNFLTLANINIIPSMADKPR